MNPQNNFKKGAVEMLLKKCLENLGQEYIATTNSIFKILNHNFQDETGENANE